MRGQYRRDAGLRLLDLVYLMGIFALLLVDHYIPGSRDVGLIVCGCGFVLPRVRLHF